MKEDLNKSIVRRIKKGDNSALEDLVIQHKGYFINGLRKKTNCNEEEANDLFIEALLEFRDKIVSGALENVLNVKSYIFGICYNMWLKEQRTKSKVFNHEKDVQSYYYDYMDDGISHLLESENDYQSELISKARRALDSLKENCKKIIQYFYIERRNMTEIAELLQFSSADVAKNTKARCFKKLVEKVKELELKPNE